MGVTFIHADASNSGSNNHHTHISCDSWQLQSIHAHLRARPVAVLIAEDETLLCLPIQLPILTVDAKEPATSRADGLEVVHLLEALEEACVGE